MHLPCRNFRSEVDEIALVLPTGFIRLIAKAIFASVIGMLVGAVLGLFIVGLVAAAVILILGSSISVLSSLDSTSLDYSYFNSLAVATLGGGALSGIFFGVVFGASVGAQVGVLSVVAEYLVKRIDAISSEPIK